jgi:hypothetical protein
MKSVQILLYDTFILLSCALSVLVMGMELVVSRKHGRLSTTAIVGLITMVARNVVMVDPAALQYIQRPAPSSPSVMTG